MSRLNSNPTTSNQAIDWSNDKQSLNEQAPSAIFA